MKSAAAHGLLVLVAISFFSLPSAVSVTPLQKVITMLEDMSRKGNNDKLEEQKEFSQFKQFCDDTSVDTTRSIEEATQTIESLAAEVADHEVNMKRLTKEIAGHNADVDAYTGDKKAATAVHAKETQDYAALNTDYSESIDALGRAITTLKTQTPDLSMLLQLPMVPDDAKSALGAFLQESPTADSYESHSQHIIGMCEKLLDKFNDERNDLQLAEQNRIAAYDRLMTELKQKINHGTEERTKKSELKAEHGQEKGKCLSQISDEEKTRAKDKEYLSNLKAECAKKTNDFEKRQKLRAEEVEAIEKAKEIIRSTEDADEQHVHLTTEAPGSFAQLRSNVQHETKTLVARYLSTRAEILHSKVLAALAVRVTNDPFQKVKKMIKDLIGRLKEEAAQEAEHKGWCDDQLEENEKTRNDKTVKVESLYAKHDQLKATIAKLTTNLGDLQDEIAHLQEAMVNATSIRQNEKAANTKAIEDAIVSQKAISNALTVLREFYAKAGEATSLLQKDDPERAPTPKIFDAPYRGMTGESGGVVGLLEVIQSDFARLEADTKAAELSSKREYDSFIQESEETKEQKQTDVEHKTASKQDNKQELQLTTEDLTGTQEELGQALKYFKELKADCIAQSSDYEATKAAYKDRTEKRKEEIKSLHDAIAILEKGS